MAVSASPAAALRIITIPFSHYNERARWALDASKVPYEEEPSAPVLHMVNVMLAGGSSAETDEKMGRTGSSRSTPCAIFPGGGALRDSGLIARFADKAALDSGAADESTCLYPSDADEAIVAIEKRLNDSLGRFARTFAYWSLREDSVFCRVTVPMLPPSQAAVGEGLMTILKPLIFLFLKINAKSAARCSERVEEEFAWVSEQLAASRGRYLAGSRFTGADLTFAALAAPVLVIQGAEGNVAVPTYPDLEDLPAETQELVKRLRATPAGQHALRMYRDHRPKVLSRVRVVDQPLAVLAFATLLLLSVAAVAGAVAGAVAWL
jgi:glutathione S-transferase